MRRGQPAPGRHQAAQYLAARGPRFEPRAQRHAGDELHGDEDRAVVDADIVGRDDVGMRQPRQGLRFAKQAVLLRPDVRQVLPVAMKQLERDIARQVRIASAIHGAHAAGAEHLGDLVAPHPRTGWQRHHR